MMTNTQSFLYRRPDGLPEVTNHAIPLDLFPGYEFIRQSDQPIDAKNKVFSETGELVDAPTPYFQLRKQNYPKLGDQLDMLWHAMDEGTLPKVEPFYSEILSVKVRYPKP